MRKSGHATNAGSDPYAIQEPRQAPYTNPYDIPQGYSPNDYVYKSTQQAPTNDPHGKTWTPEEQKRKQLNDLKIEKDNLEKTFLSMPTTDEVVKWGELDDEIKKLQGELGKEENTNASGHQNGEIQGNAQLEFSSQGTLPLHTQMDNDTGRDSIYDGDGRRRRETNQTADSYLGQDFTDSVVEQAAETDGNDGGSNAEQDLGPVPTTPPDLSGQNYMLETASKAIIEQAEKFFGDLYTETDCSDLVEKAFQNLGLFLPGTANRQAEYCHKYGCDIPIEGEYVDDLFILDESMLEPGDLLFYKMSDRKEGKGYEATHVVIYAGDGKIIHSRSAGEDRGPAYEDLYWEMEESEFDFSEGHKPVLIARVYPTIHW